MAVDLFEAAAEGVLEEAAPLAERLRPRTLDEVVGQREVVGPDGTLRRLLRAGRLPSVILWGPPGAGKTTIARLVCDDRNDVFVPLSAVTANVADIRREVDAATHRLGANGHRTVVFLDEIHRFTRTQQDALLPSVERGVLSLVGATTESPWATLVGPLLSRCTVLQLHPLDEADQRALLARAATATGATISEPAAQLVVATADGDGRKLLTMIEVAVEVARGQGRSEVSEADARHGLGAGDLRYGTGAHYDAASAFIKWMRHSRPEQAIAWLVHMLDGGEDPRFLARRMVIFASEDVGHADPRALLIADAAARAVESVGLPEARYNLAQAAGYLARAPKSNDVVHELDAAAHTERVLPPEMGGDPL
ncbi:MAG TPA: AAA family ATPase [Microthrixaceae bacterium]|nr:AAA family ATPase [Microthrixaceae bacterium]